jgi:hypothetical protein
MINFRDEQYLDGIDLIHAYLEMCRMKDTEKIIDRLQEVLLSVGEGDTDAEMDSEKISGE